MIDLPEHEIVFIGWDSIVWDRQNLPVRSLWKQEGPTLPIEFSRISLAEHGILKPVIDYQNGSEIRTWFTPSMRNTVMEAVRDLKKRENIPDKQIGYIDFINDDDRSSSRNLRYDLRTWARRHGFDGIVWCDLNPNFFEVTRRNFSPENALEYLKSLRPSAFREALDFIENTPVQISTPLRRKVHEMFEQIAK